jgi:bacillithiol system protein YtxJ
MGNKFVRVTDVTEFEKLIERSRTQPVVIFKHSISCGVSAAVYQKMIDFDGEIAVVEIQRARELSREIADKTGIKHESPQVLVLRNGQVVWDASHFQITSDAVAKAFMNNL